MALSRFLKRLFALYCKKLFDMDATPQYFETIEDSELLRRDFFSRFRDEETGEWGTSAFRLRPTTRPPENYLSLARVRFAPDAAQHATTIYTPKRLKTLEGYVQVLASDMRRLDIAPLRCDVYAIGSEESPHAGFFTWLSERDFLDANSDVPEALGVQSKLLYLTNQSYQDYPKEVKEKWKSPK